MSRLSLHWIEPGSDYDNFPPTRAALKYPDGLLCFGGDLDMGRLLTAYPKGIFPWYSDGQPIMWWSPSPRCVLLPGEFKMSRSLKKVCRNGRFEFALDRDFAGVIESCAAPRNDDPCTWITTDMMLAYKHLHTRGTPIPPKYGGMGDWSADCMALPSAKYFLGNPCFRKCAIAQRQPSPVLHVTCWIAAFN